MDKVSIKIAEITVPNHHQIIHIQHYLEFMRRDQQKVVVIVIFLIPLRCTLFKQSNRKDTDILILIIFPFRQWNAKQIHEYGGRKSSTVRSVFHGIWYTIVSLTILLITVYLLLMSIKTPSNKSTTNSGTFFIV